MLGSMDGKGFALPFPLTTAGSSNARFGVGGDKDGAAELLVITYKRMRVKEVRRVVNSWRLPSTRAKVSKY